LFLNCAVFILSFFLIADASREWVFMYEVVFVLLRGLGFVGGDGAGAQDFVGAVHGRVGFEFIGDFDGFGEVRGTLL
jgi:hypothetical protein